MVPRFKIPAVARDPRRPEWCEDHGRARTIIENDFALLKRKWPLTQERMRTRDVATNLDNLITTAAIFHNAAIALGKDKLEDDMDIFFTFVNIWQ